MISLNFPTGVPQGDTKTNMHSHTELFKFKQYFAAINPSMVYRTDLAFADVFYSFIFYNI